MEREGETLERDIPLEEKIKRIDDRLEAGAPLIEIVRGLIGVVKELVPHHGSDVFEEPMKEISAEMVRNPVIPVDPKIIRFK